MYSNCIIFLHGKSPFPGDTALHFIHIFIIAHICSFLKRLFDIFQKITPALSIFEGLTIESLTLNSLPGGKEISFLFLYSKHLLCRFHILNNRDFKRTSCFTGAALDTFSGMVRKHRIMFTNSLRDFSLSPSQI